MLRASGKGRRYGLYNAFARPFDNEKQWLTIKTYITKNYTDSWVGDERVSLSFVDKQAVDPLGEIKSASPAQLQHLEIKNIAPELLPALGAYRELMKTAFGPAGRNLKQGQRIVFRGIQSPLPGKKVYLEVLE